MRWQTLATALVQLYTSLLNTGNVYLKLHAASALRNANKNVKADETCDAMVQPGSDP
jgi:hypothetical protein